MSHLDELFEKSFQEKFRLFEQEWSEFRASHAHWTEQKTYREMLLRLRKERNGMTESKWKNDGDSHLSASLFEYKTALFNWFQSRHNDYIVNPVYHFMQEEYPKLKERFLIKFSHVSHFNSVINSQLSEFYLDEKEVVEQLAHYEAALKFIDKLEVEEHHFLMDQRYSGKSEAVSLNEKADLLFPNDVLDLIEKGRDLEAIERLSSYLKGNEFSDDFIKEAIQIQAILANAENDFGKGRINPEDKSLQFNRARPLILDLLKQIENQGK